MVFVATRALPSQRATGNIGVPITPFNELMHRIQPQSVRVSTEYCAPRSTSSVECRMITRTTSAFRISGRQSDAFWRDLPIASVAIGWLKQDLS